MYECVRLLLLFFFKQKTAYEMRISDWSSDVCSSDLDDPLALVFPDYAKRFAHCGKCRQHRIDRQRIERHHCGDQHDEFRKSQREFRIGRLAVVCGCTLLHRRAYGLRGLKVPVESPRSSDELPALFTTRSEEHTSELQSLMRISYAVFCLKKKKQEH